MAKRRMIYALSGKRRGIILVLVIWVLILLSGLALEFSRSMRMEVRMTRNFLESSQAYYLAKAGIQTAIYELIKQTRLQYAQNQQNSEASSVWRVNTDIPDFTFWKGKFKIRIDNESGKVDINNANEALLKMVLDAFPLDNTQKGIITDSILDWRDPDDLHRLNGAESDYYQSLDNPYSSKNDEFDSIDELLFVRGITPELFYGGLDEMVTVTPADDKQLQRSRRIFRKRLSMKAQSRININAAPHKLLAALPSMNDELAGRVEAFRGNRDIKALNELSEILGANVFAAITPFITLEYSPYYRIVAVGEFNTSPVKNGVEAVVKIDAKEPSGFRLIEWSDSLY